MFPPRVHVSRRRRSEARGQVAKVFSSPARPRKAHARFYTVKPADNEAFDGGSVGAWGDKAWSADVPGSELILR